MLFGVFALSLLVALANGSRAPKSARKKVKPMKAVENTTTTTTGNANFGAPVQRRSMQMEKEQRSKAANLKTVKATQVDPNAPWYMCRGDEKENRRNIYQTTYFERPKNVVQKKKEKVEKMAVIESEDEDSDGNDKKNKKPVKKPKAPENKDKVDSEKKTPAKKPKVQEKKDKVETEKKKQVKKPKVQEEKKENDSDCEERKEEREFKEDWWMADKNISLCNSKPFAEGAYGQVYRATYKGKGRVVIKVMTMIECDPSFEYRKNIAANEINVWKNLDSKWLVKFHFSLTMGTRDHLQYVICMEDGGLSLDKLYESDFIDQVKNSEKARFDRVEYFGVLIAKALAACHSARVLHRDLALKNVLVDDIGNIKLCDFGFAVVMDQKGKASGRYGTVSYMSPKMLSGKEYGPEVDYYSLGACLVALNELDDPLSSLDDEEIPIWHQRGRTLWDALSDETHVKIGNAVKKLCSSTVESEESARSLSLFKAKYNLSVVPAPESVLADIYLFHLQDTL